MTARQCGALAMTDNGKIWGGATRAERDAAERAAVENCEKRTTHLVPAAQHPVQPLGPVVK